MTPELETIRNYYRVAEPERWPDMPVHVEKRGSKYRIVEPGGRLARARHGEGRPVDGGGHKSKAKAHRQAAYINEGSSK